MFGVVAAEEGIGTMIIGLVPILLCSNRPWTFGACSAFFILSVPKISFYNNGDEVRRRWARYRRWLSYGEKDDPPRSYPPVNSPRP
jgi:hypothetical protein